MVAGADQACVVGVDFGTLSGRAVVVRAMDGAELGSAVHDYRNGVMDTRLPATGEPLPPDWALQDPEDYRDVLRAAVPAAIAAAGIDPASVVGIGTDFTACTILPVLADGTPLCQLPGLAGRPHAYVKLWKHHAGQPQADRINALAHERGEPWIARYGGRISSGGQDGKGRQLLEEEPRIYHRADRRIEAADWLLRPPAANAIGPGQMVLIMGTSTCHVMNGAKLAEVPGMCGVVDGGIVAGRWGYEAGQTGVGDIFAWFADHAVPPAYHAEAASRGMSVHDLLSAEA